MCHTAEEHSHAKGYSLKDYFASMGLSGMHSILTELLIICSETRTQQI